MNMRLIIGLLFIYSFTPQLQAAELIGRAILPAATFAEGPPSGAYISRQFDNLTLPFDNQPVQGVSAALLNSDGSFWAMSDNGFGRQENSRDYQLRVYRLRADLKTASGGTGTIQVEEFFTLRDPNRLISFPIVNDDSEERILTGADFDLESIQRVADGSFWFGDEFGPFLLHTDATGVLLDAPISLPDFSRQGRFLMSPQHPLLPDDVPQPARVASSGGFEGMALSHDGKLLMPLLEKPLIDRKVKVLQMHIFDLATKRYTDQIFYYSLEPEAFAIGDFIMLSADEGLVIERDHSQGKLDGFKAIYKITFPKSGQMLKKRRVVDLLKIADPQHIAQAQPDDIGIGDGQFAFPFITIESLFIFDAAKQQIAVLNDNNYPFSRGRSPTRPDDTELIVLQLPHL